MLLAAPPPGSSTLPAVLRLCGKLDLLDQVWGRGEDGRGWGHWRLQQGSTMNFLQTSTAHKFTCIPFALYALTVSVAGWDILCHHGLQVLLRLSACGHKVLLFCTMTRCLDLIEEYLTWR